MEDVKLYDVVALTALGLLALAIALFGGLLDPLIHELNKNSGAIMALAAVVTAGATVLLVFLNRATWGLYQRELDQDKANRIRLAGECREAERRVRVARRQWERFQDRDLEDIREALHFNHALQRTQDLLEDLEPSVERWTQEVRTPDLARLFSLIRQSRTSAELTLPREDQDPTELHSLVEWAEFIEPALHLLETNLEIGRKRLR